MILFIKHIDIEGPDLLDVFFKEKGFQTETAELQNGDTLPENLIDIDAIISLGGPMNVYEEDKYPFLKGENQFIKKVIEKEIPFIGICLGSQLLAKACGKKVKESPEEEIGFLPVQLTQQGCGDPLFKGLGNSIDVFHWHKDMSELSQASVLLAASEGCPHQAFKVGPCAYGIQFHFEVTEPTIDKWIEAYFSKSDSAQMQRKQIIIDHYRRKRKQFYKISDTINNNFLNILRKSNKKKQAYDWEKCD